LIPINRTYIFVGGSKINTELAKEFVSKKKNGLENYGFLIKIKDYKKIMGR